MRFIGNKESITDEIYALLENKNLTNKGLILFDAFCGVGSVADTMKSSFNIIINDILLWCVTYTKGRINANLCTFNKLGFDPINYLNDTNERIKGFFYENYSPGNSFRKYFTIENAGRIDYFRYQIEQWKSKNLLTENEYCFLIASLIESISDVSNTAGVYGAYLKKWDPRSQKPINFKKIKFRNIVKNESVSYNEKIENIIERVKCDVLYLDPPYTQNQYGTQYHLLETLVKNDNPKISKITGSRYTAPMRSDWSKSLKANILFDTVVAKTKARFVILSYNNDGIMSKEFIESNLKRYGISKTYFFKKFKYKQYNNWKSENNKEHYEYLFFIEKKDSKKVIFESPLNYIGSKAKMIDEIRQHNPAAYKKVYDIFGGGFNVGVNLLAEKIIYNDINCFVTGLIKSFREIDTYDYVKSITNITIKYKLKQGDSDAYIKARNKFNFLPKTKRNPIFLYTIILYGFQQQIRFNDKHEFNNPAGNRWFNEKVLEKFISFSRRIKEIDCFFESKDFYEFKDEIETNSFVYLDPPYRFTRGTYNDGKRGFLGWKKEHELAMFEFLDELSLKNIDFMLSYVLENNGHYNEQLIEWLEKNKRLRMIDVSTFQGRYNKRKEILIVNYE